MRDQRSNDHDKYAVAVKNESDQIVAMYLSRFRKICASSFVTVERLRWSVLDTNTMWVKEKDSRFLSIIGCLEISSICKE